jgi:hypothetical protein
MNLKSQFLLIIVTGGSTFFVKSQSSPSIFPSLTRTFVEFWETPLDKATYNWPWLKTCRGKSIPTLGMVYPYDLFMVIAKLSLTVNCFLLSTKGSPELTFVFNLILDKNALFPALLPVRISTSNIFLNKPRHNNHVPLHRPYLGSMFRNNIKGAPFFSFKVCGGILPWAIEFRNSCWYKLWVSPSTSSNDNKLRYSPGNWLIINIYTIYK